MRLKRQLPQVSELKNLMRFERPTLDRRAARLAEAADVWDLRKIAKRRIPKAAFDYVDGAARDEVTYDESRETFRSIRLLPHVLTGATELDLSVDIAGGRSALPFGIAPTGFTRFMHAEGEDAGHRQQRRQVFRSRCRQWVRAPWRRSSGPPDAAPLVPALSVEGPRGQRGVATSRGGEWLRHARRHCRYPGRGPAPARYAQRHAHPAAAHRWHRS